MTGAVVKQDIRTDCVLFYILAHARFTEEIVNRFGYAGAPFLTGKRLRPLLEAHYAGLEAMTDYSNRCGSLIIHADLLDVYEQELTGRLNYDWN